MFLAITSDYISLVDSVQHAFFTNVKSPIILSAHVTVGINIFQLWYFFGAIVA